MLSADKADVCGWRYRRKYDD